MIKRTPSKANMSLVNVAQEDHLSVSGGIVTPTPVTNLQTVKRSVNFELDNDGAYILRKPLVLKEAITAKDTYFLYDKETKVVVLNGDITIQSDHTIYQKLKFYDYHAKMHLINHTGFSFITELINVYNAPDHTLLSVKINHDTFYNETLHKLVHTPEDYNPNLYRFIKIYRDTSISDNTWVVEIVHPELNSLVGSTNANAQQFDVNMLLDNPYAIRDLYDYGYVSTSKILAYLPISYTAAQLNANTIPVYRLTESNPISSYGFKLIVSANNTTHIGPIVLKAFITNINVSRNVKYYCCWERSLTGSDWEACPEFLNKFTNTAYEEKKVSDISYTEFENMIFSDSLEKAATYLVTKKVVLLTSTNEEDYLKDRPDVLVIDASALNYKYRFCIYIDTEKEVGDKTVDKTTAKNYFTSTNLNDTADIKPYLNDNKVLSYETLTGNSILVNGDHKEPEIQNGIIVLHPGRTEDEVAYVGNKLIIKKDTTTNARFKKIKITLAEKLKSTDGNDNVVYSQINTGLGYLKRTSLGYGTYGAYISEYFPEDDGVNQFIDVYHLISPEFRAYLDYLALGEGPWDGTWIKLVNKAVADASDWESVDSTHFVVFGYQELAGWYFEFYRDGVFFGTQVTRGQIVVATPTGWQIKDAVNHDNITVNSYTERLPVVDTHSVYASAEDEITIEFTEEDKDIIDVMIGCTSAFYFPPSENNNGDHTLRIAGIEVEYEMPLINAKTTSVYLTSQTGEFQIPYSTDIITAEDLSNQHESIFHSEIYFDKGSYNFFTKDYVYYSDPDSFIIKALNVLGFSNTVTRLISYRNYLVVFTTKDISLLYKTEDSGYSIKVISSTVGISKEDAKTVIVILNSIYFKSGTKIYKLVPNLYAYKDDVINIHPISGPIDALLADVVNNTFETSNFGYSDVSTYRVFIPSGNSITYCFIYDLASKTWTLQKYPVALSRLEINTLEEAYVVKDMVGVDGTSGGFYHFKDDLDRVLEKIRLQDISYIGGTTTDDIQISSIKVKYKDDYGIDIIRPIVYGKSTYKTIDAKTVYSKIPYGDYLHKTPVQLYTFINGEALNLLEENPSTNFSSLKISSIPFLIDFGQKSSNYMLDKQFLESKLIFATLHPKDQFPVTLDITTDGLEKPLHWDCNTDSALWKNSFVDLGTLNTTFQEESTDYDGILRQLIVKYSGKGKTARHLISGNSMYRFKFLSMNQRYRILPKKQ